MRKSVFWSFFAVLAILLTACSQAPEELQQEMTVKTEITGPLFVAQDHSVTGKDVMLDKVILDKSGYVVIHADADGKPGSVLAHSDLLKAGEYTNLKVDVTTLEIGSTKLWVMLHYDNGDGNYDFPGDDAPIVMDGTSLSKLITVTYSVEESAGKIKLTKHTAIKTADGYVVKFGLQNLEATASSTTIVIRLYYGGAEVAKQSMLVELGSRESKDFELEFVNPPKFVGYNIEGDALTNPLNK